MKTIGIIPARAGSKGIPGKNKALVAGKPLVLWSIEQAKDAGLDHVVVTTDDPEVGWIAREAGVDVRVRPERLATDTASTDDVVRDVVEYVGAEYSDPLVLLQPTVPTRRPGLVAECVMLFSMSGADSLMTGKRAHFVWQRDGVGGDLGWTSNAPSRPRRQDLNDTEQRFIEDGAVYVFTPRTLRVSGSRVGGNLIIFEHNDLMVDIDSPEDLALASWILTRPTGV